MFNTVRYVRHVKVHEPGTDMVITIIQHIVFCHAVNLVRNNTQIFNRDTRAFTDPRRAPNGNAEGDDYSEAA